MRRVAIAGFLVLLGLSGLLFLVREEPSRVATPAPAGVAQKTAAASVEPAPTTPAELVSRFVPSPENARRLSRRIDPETGLPEGVTMRRRLRTDKNRSARVKRMEEMIEKARLDDVQQQLLFQIFDDIGMETQALTEELVKHSHPDDPLFWQIDEIQSNFLTEWDREVRRRAAGFLTEEQMKIFTRFVGPGGFGTVSDQYLVAVE